MLLPANRYIAILDAFDFDRAKTGNIVWKGSFRVIEEGEFRGSRVPFAMTFTENTWEQCEKALKALGWSGFDDDDFTRYTLRQFSKRVEIQVEHEEAEMSDGEVRTFARVQWVNPLVMVFDPLDDAAKRGLFESFKGHRNGGAPARAGGRAARPSSAGARGSSAAAGVAEPGDSRFEGADHLAPPRGA